MQGSTFFLNFFDEFFKRFYLFLERGEKEKERERNISVWLPLTCPLVGTWPATQACSQVGNRTGDTVHRSVFSPLSHTSRATMCKYLKNSLRIALCRLISLALTLNRFTWNYGHLRLASLEIASDGRIYFAVKTEVIWSGSPLVSWFFLPQILFMTSTFLLSSDFCMRRNLSSCRFLIFIE